MGKVENYTQAAINIANDNRHGYSQLHRNGNPDYDCSSLVCTVVKASGINIHGATYTGNIYSGFVLGGFKDVTRNVNLSNGSGLVRGDILLNPSRHVEIYIGNGKTVGAHSDERGGIRGDKAGDQTGNEISVKAYRNYPWKYVLRYSGNDGISSLDTVAREVLAGQWGNGNDRKTRLTNAGYDYNAVQQRVNELVNINPGTKSVDVVAREVIAGKWGNGNDRKTRLTNAGYDYNAVQKRVNELLS